MDYEDGLITKNFKRKVNSVIRYRSSIKLNYLLLNF